MQMRTAPRLEVPVSVLGHGMWGLAGWKDTDDALLPPRVATCSVKPSSDAQSGLS